MNRLRGGSVVVLAAGLLSAFATIDHYHVGAFHDDAAYVILARSLATGHGYRYLNLPGENVASHFPPGFPLLLSLLWRVWPVFPANVVAFKAANGLLLAVSAVVSAELARRRFASERVATAFGVVTALSVPVMVLSALVLSEMLFLLTVLLALVVAERGPDETSGTGRAILLGALIGASLLVRSHGIVLLGAVLAVILVRKQWRVGLVVLLSAVATVAPWQIWSALHSSSLPGPLAGNYGSYTAWWLRGYATMGIGMIPSTLARTTSELTGMLLALFSPLDTAAAHLLTALALASLVFAGCFRRFRRAPVTSLFLLGYLLIVVLWPFNPSRFVWGIWPLLLLHLLSGALAAPEYKSRSAQLALACCATWLVLGYGAYEVRGWRGAWWRSVPRGADGRLAAAIAYAQTNTLPGDLIAADDEGAVFLYTGRKTVPVASFTVQHYLAERSAMDEAREGLVPLLGMYPIRTVLVGGQRTFEAAATLTQPPSPTLALRARYPDGAAFTVLTK